MTGRPAIASKIPSKSLCWRGSSFSSARRRSSSLDAMIMSRTSGQAVVGHEHVLGAAEADALGAELARLGRVLGRVRVRAHLEAAHLVGPAEDRLEVLVDLRRHERDGAEDDASGAAVDREQVVFAEVVAVERGFLRLRVDRERLAPGDARLAHPAGDDRSVRGHAAVRREDPLGGDHPVDVVRGRLPADEDHVVAGRAALGGGVGVEHDLPGCGSGRRVQALRDHLDARRRVDHRMQELVELAGVDARDGVLAGDEPLLDHVDGRLQRRRGGALRASRLQEVEPSVLDGELDVLHVAVVLLESPHRLGELLEGVRQDLLHLGDVLRRPDARDDVLALRVGQELAVEPRLARRGVAREGDTGSRLVALVAEDHLHDVDRRAEVVGDVVCAPVDLCPRSLPRVEDGSHGPPQLVPRVLWERCSGLALVRPLVGLDQGGQVLGRQVDVLGRAALVLQPRQRILEQMVGDPVHDLAVHLDQAAVRVVGEAGVAGALGEALDRLVVETEVEDRVHHPGHRDRGSGADRDEQRVLRIAELLAGLLLEPGEVLVDFLAEPVGQLAARGHVRAAGVGRDREPCRDGHAELRHLGQADAFAPQQLAATLARLVEVVDESVRSHSGNLPIFRRSA